MIFGIQETLKRLLRCFSFDQEKITNEAKKNNAPLFKENSVSEIVAIKKVDEPTVGCSKEVVDAE